MSVQIAELAPQLHFRLPEDGELATQATESAATGLRLLHVRRVGEAVGGVTVEAEASSEQHAQPATLGANGIGLKTGEMQFAMGDTSQQEFAESAGLRDDLAQEKYNRSLRAYRELGRMVLRDELQTELGEAALENVRRDIVTSLAEMFENSEEFRGHFEITDVYSYPIIDGRVHFMTADGPKAMEQVTVDGAAVSEAVAATDPLMAPQAERDKADVFNSRRVDVMASGRLGSINTRIALSRDLGAIIKPGSPYRELYMGKGYREGLSFLQLYFAEDDVVFAGTLSIDGVSDEVFDIIMARHEAAMPEGVSRHESVKYGIEKTFPNKEAALAFAKQFRKDCYALQRDRRARHSATEFIESHRAEIDGYIKALGVPLSSSIGSGVKHGLTHDFVSGLLAKPDHIKPEVLQQLRRIRESNTFTDDDGRLLSGITVYAIAEALYGSAHSYVKDEQPATVTVQQNISRMPVEQTLRHLVHNVHTGVEAGRSHSGGCPGEVALSNKSKDSDPLNPQGAFGGREGEKESVDKTKRKNWETKKGKCIIKSCPNSEKIVECGPCGVCMERCQEQYYDRGKDPEKLGVVDKAKAKVVKTFNKLRSWLTGENKPEKPKKVDKHKQAAVS